LAIFRFGFPANREFYRDFDAFLQFQAGLAPQNKRHFSGLLSISLTALTGIFSTRTGISIPITGI